MARAYVGMEKRLGVPPERLLTLPEDRTKPEAMNDIYRALGRPDAADGYAVAVADGAPEYLGAYAKDLATELHPLGVSKEAMDKIVEITNRSWEAQVKDLNDATAADQLKIDTEIKTQWGDQADAMRQAVTNRLKDEIDATPNLTADQKAARWEALKDELAGGLGKSPILFGILAKDVQSRMEGGIIKPGDVPASLTGALSADQAVAGRNAFYADQTKMAAWRDNTHPNHKAAVDEMNRFNKAIVGLRKTARK